MTNPQFTAWRKSSRSSGGANCVEVSPAANLAVVGVRDTKDRDAGTLIFALDEWQAFIAAVRDGEFDLD